MSVTDLEIQYLNSKECYNYITKITKNFKNIPSPTYYLNNKLVEVDRREYIPYIQKSILLSPKIYYGRLYVKSDISYAKRNILSRIMGRKCVKLYLLARKYNLILVWYNNRTKEFIFYSNTPNSIIRGMTYLYLMIERYKSFVQ